MDHIGIDVHKRDSQIYILAEGGEIVEQRIRTEPERFAAVLGARPRARIVLEASTDSEWVARCLEAFGHEVIVADPNFAPMYATRTRKVKTDRRDVGAVGTAHTKTSRGPREPAALGGILAKCSGSGGGRSRPDGVPQRRGAIGGGGGCLQVLSRRAQGAVVVGSGGAGPGLCPEWGKLR
jgi:hypothetical protein